jgi:hypothetical protein
MERHKYNAEFQKMQVFALKSSDLDQIKGGNFFQDLLNWVDSLLNKFDNFSDSPDPDGNVGHGGGPK